MKKTRHTIILGALILAVFGIAGFGWGGGFRHLHNAANAVFRSDGFWISGSQAHFDAPTGDEFILTDSSRTLYRECGNEISAIYAQNGQQLAIKTLVGGPGKILPNKNRPGNYLLVPEKHWFVVKGAILEDGTEVSVPPIRFEVANPPDAISRFKQFGHELILDDTVLNRAKMMYYAFPEQSFERRAPRDAQLSLEKIIVMAYLELGSPTIIGEVDCRGKDLRKGVEIDLFKMTKSIPKGRKLMFRPVNLQRKTYQGNQVSIMHHLSRLDLRVHLK